MSRFQNLETGVVVSVADHKDHRFSAGWIEPVPEPTDGPAKRAPGRPKKSDD